MKIDLNDRELYAILSDKFGDASFSLYFTENGEGYEKRTGMDLSKMERPPEVKQTVAFISEKLTIVP